MFTWKDKHCDDRNSVIRGVFTLPAKDVQVADEVRFACTSDRPKMTSLGRKLSGLRSRTPAYVTRKCADNDVTVPPLSCTYQKPDRWAEDRDGWSAMEWLAEAHWARIKHIDALHAVLTTGHPTTSYN